MGFWEEEELPSKGIHSVKVARPRRLLEEGLMRVFCVCGRSATT